MNIYTNLAKNTLELYLTKNKLPNIKNLDPKLSSKRAACFVSLHSKNGDLRGCIGTILPTNKNLAGEIIMNTIEAAFHDPRFKPITLEELKDLKFSVDILSEPERIDSNKLLDPKKYGVIVRSNDGRQGLLLPNLEGIDAIDKQLDIAHEKAGIEKNEDVLLYRFISERQED